MIAFMYSVAKYVLLVPLLWWCVPAFAGTTLGICVGAQVWSFIALQVLRSTPCMRHIPADSLPDHNGEVDSRLFLRHISAVFVTFQGHVWLRWGFSNLMLPALQAVAGRFGAPSAVPIFIYATHVFYLLAPAIPA